MWQVSADFHEAMRTSHIACVKADLYRGGVLVASDIDVVQGTVIVDGKSQVRRTADVQIAVSESLSLVKESEFVPNGTEIALYRGVDFGNGKKEWCPLGVFRIDTATLTRPGLTLQLRCSDRTILVQDDRFLVPQERVASSVKGEIRHLLNQTSPGIRLNDHTDHDIGMWPVVWETERWEALEKLAKSLHATIYFDPDGTPAIAPEVPSGAPVWRFGIGDDGTVTHMVTELSRLDTYNAVVVVGGDPMGENPVPPQVARDTDPASVTRWDGPFGHRPKFFSSQFINTPAQAMDVAVKMLAEERGLQRRVTLTAIPHPALDAGDLVEVEFVNGIKETHVIERLSFGLGAEALMSVTTMSVRS